MKKLSKDDIFKADDLPTKDMDIPEWGGMLTIRTLTGAERDLFALGLAGGGATLGLAVAFAVRALACAVRVQRELPNPRLQVLRHLA